MKPRTGGTDAEDGVRSPGAAPWRTNSARSDKLSPNARWAWIHVARSGAHSGQWLRLPRPRPPLTRTGSGVPASGGIPGSGSTLDLDRPPVCDWRGGT